MNNNPKILKVDDLVVTLTPNLEKGFHLKIGEIKRGGEVIHELIVTHNVRFNFVNNWPLFIDDPEPDACFSGGLVYDGDQQFTDEQWKKIYMFIVETYQKPLHSFNRFLANDRWAYMVGDTISDLDLVRLNLDGTAEKLR